MKKSIILTLAVSALVSSCGEKKNQGASETFRAGIVLGAFLDVPAQQTTLDFDCF
jgi:Na+-driven multidrug efflux pump